MGNRRLRTIVSWNTHVGRSPGKVVRGLRNLIRDTDADVIVLQEARGYVTALRLAFPTWRIYARRGWADSNHCPVMVRRNLPRGRRYGRGWDTVRIEAPWAYRGTPKPGRTWTWVRVDGVCVLSLHRIPGHSGDNTASYLEEAHQLREWFEDHDGPMVAFGDANESPRYTRASALLTLSRQVGGTLAFDRDEPGIDYALVRGLRAHVQRTNPYGSDHRAAVLTIKE